MNLARQRVRTFGRGLGKVDLMKVSFGEEMIINTGMELAFTAGVANGYTKDTSGGNAGTYTDDAATFRSGAHSQKINLAGEKFYFKHTGFTFKSGWWYRFLGYAHADAASKLLTLYFSDVAVGQYSQAFVLTNGSFIQLVHLFQASQDTVAGEVGFRFDAVQTFNLRIDDVSLKPINMDSFQDVGYIEGGTVIQVDGFRDEVSPAGNEVPLDGNRKTQILWTMQQAGIDELQLFDELIGQPYAVRYSGVENDKFLYFCMEKAEVLKSESLETKQRKIPLVTQSTPDEYVGYATKNIYLASGNKKIETDNLALWVDPQLGHNFGLTKLLDISGYARHGDLSHAAIWKDKVLQYPAGKLLEFNGTSNYIDFGNVLNLNSPNLLRNGDAEEGVNLVDGSTVTGWLLTKSGGAASTCVANITTPLVGTYDFKFSTVATSNLPRVQQIFTGLVPGKTYAVYFRMKMNNGALTDGPAFRIGSDQSSSFPFDLVNYPLVAGDCDNTIKLKRWTFIATSNWVKVTLLFNTANCTGGIDWYWEAYLGEEYDFLFEIWARVLGADGANAALLGTKSALSNAAQGIYWIRGTTNVLSFNLSDGVANQTLGFSGTMLKNIWKQISVYGSRSGNGQGYLNGATDGAALSLTGVGNVYNALPLYLGRVGTTYGNSQLGLLRVYLFPSGTSIDHATIVADNYAANRSRFNL